MSLNNSPATAHIERLDVLRGFSILAVYFFHVLYATFGIDKLEWNGNWRDLSSAPDSSYLVFYLYSFGWIGVKLFFVLSGFCIHLSFLKWLRKSKVNARESGWQQHYIIAFLLRRFWRIYPAYLVALLLFSFLRRLDLSLSSNLFEFLSHLFLIHNLNRETYFGQINGSFWSVAVEWQLYLIYPLILIAMPRFGTKKVFVLVLILTLFLNRIDIPSDNYLILKLPFFYWLEWTFGALIAAYWLDGKRLLGVLGGWPTLLVGSLFLLANLFRPLDGWLFPLGTLVCGIFLEWYIHQKSLLNQVEKALASLGIISYSVYLLHQPFLARSLDLMHHIKLLNNPYCDLTINAVVILLPILVLSYGFYRFIEVPGIQFGYALARKRSTSLPTNLNKLI